MNAITSMDCLPLSCSSIINMITVFQDNWDSGDCSFPCVAYFYVTHLMNPDLPDSDLVGVISMISNGKYRFSSE